VLEAADEARLAFAGATRGVAARGVAGVGEWPVVVAAWVAVARVAARVAVARAAAVARVAAVLVRPPVARWSRSSMSAAARPRLPSASPLWWPRCGAASLLLRDDRARSLDMTEQIVAHDPPSAAELEALRSRAAARSPT